MLPKLINFKFLVYLNIWFNFEIQQDIYIFPVPRQSELQSEIPYNIVPLSIYKHFVTICLRFLDYFFSILNSCHSTKMIHTLTLLSFLSLFLGFLLLNIYLRYLSLFHNEVNFVHIIDLITGYEYNWKFIAAAPPPPFRGSTYFTLHIFCL